LSRGNAQESQPSNRTAPHGILGAPFASAKHRQKLSADSPDVSHYVTEFCPGAHEWGAMAMQPGDFIAQLNWVRSDYFRINHAFRGIKISKAGTYMDFIFISAEVFYRVVGHVRPWDSDSRWMASLESGGE
jgi:hypothetical protein